MSDETRQLLWTMSCICASLAGVLDPDDLVGHLEPYAAHSARVYGSDAVLRAMIDAVRRMSREKRDVDQRLAISVGVAPT